MATKLQTKKLKLTQQWEGVDGMTGEIAELSIEFMVILVSPVLYHYYLWRYKKVEKKILFQNIKIYASLYTLVALAGLVLFLKQ